MINGSLVKTLSMARCRFLGCKRGVYFTSTLNGQSMLYKMSEDALSGKVGHILVIHTLAFAMDCM